MSGDERSTTAPNPRVSVTADEGVLDRVMPVWDARILVAEPIDRSAEDAWETLHDFDMLSVRSPVLSASFALRALPNRLLRRPEPPPPPSLRLGDGVGLPGWIGLGVVDGREIAAGAIGVFWTPSIVWHDDVTPETFAEFDQPGWGRIAIAFSIVPRDSDSSIVIYECRTHTTDDDSRRRFLRYWRLIRPFVAHIMRAAVRTIRKQAETTVLLHEDLSAGSSA
jgi:hypothetical protein